jgi:hypothetical protein
MQESWFQFFIFNDHFSPYMEKVDVEVFSYATWPHFLSQVAQGRRRNGGYAFLKVFNLYPLGRHLFLIKHV